MKQLPGVQQPIFLVLSGGMEDWDQDTLEDVINKKHGNTNITNKTEIVSLLIYLTQCLALKLMFVLILNIKKQHFEF